MLISKKVLLILTIMLSWPALSTAMLAYAAKKMAAVTGPLVNPKKRALAAVGNGGGSSGTAIADADWAEKLKRAAERKAKHAEVERESYAAKKAKEALKRQQEFYDKEILISQAKGERLQKENELAFVSENERKLH